MSKTIKSIRGMHDILPNQSPAWQSLERTLRALMQSYHLQEIRTPIVEAQELFCRSIGDVTDIVEKEMYAFEDRNGDKLALRPEGTASCVRAGIQHGLFYNQTQRLWYMGTMYRHERPQKGRYREFRQFGVEAYGIATPDIEAEIIAISAQLWQRLGIDAQLEINTLGTVEERANYREKLIVYYEQHLDALDEDAKRRLHSNPLRILDSKNPAVIAINQNAPKLIDGLGEHSLEHYTQLKALLDEVGIAYVENPNLVRGLDYYCHTVFEWVTTTLGAQGTICAGGRYDGLVEQLGGKPTPAFGFAAGMDRLLAMLEAQPDKLPEQSLDVYVLNLSDNTHTTYAYKVAEALRGALPQKAIQLHCGGGSFKSQLKKADRLKATFAVICGDNEAENQTLTLKNLRNGEQVTDTLDGVLSLIQNANE